MIVNRSIKCNLTVYIMQKQGNYLKTKEYIWKSVGLSKLCFNSKIQKSQGAKWMVDRWPNMVYDLKELNYSCEIFWIKC